MKHFKREAMIQADVYVAIVVLGMAAMFAVPALMTFIESDRCMDAGGAYNYEHGVCVEPRKSPG
jgi:hypothetical protein